MGSRLLTLFFEVSAVPSGPTNQAKLRPPLNQVEIFGRLPELRKKKPLVAPALINEIPTSVLEGWPVAGAGSRRACRLPKLLYADTMRPYADP